jgi:DNA repair protein RadC
MRLELKANLAVKEAVIDGTVLTSPQSVECFLADMKVLAQEAFVVITLNSKNRVITRHLVSIGTVSTALVHPRETFRPAILDGASSVILAHNHPSGDSVPSAEDIKITRQLVKAGEYVGIAVLDHVIIGDQPLSLREAGLVTF